MQIETYDGNTWVAYLDISGFKAMMKDKKKALDALDHFYQYGYDVLRDHADRYRRELAGGPAMNGLFFSDCGILFLRLNNTHAENALQEVQPLLDIVATLSRKMIRHDIMVSTSIAFGHFRYEERQGFQVMQKNMVYGNAFVSAYLDNEVNEPRLKPGHCRIVLDELAPLAPRLNQGLTELRERKMRYQGHLMYYWMVEHDDDIGRFQEEFSRREAHDWKGMCKLINTYAHGPTRTQRGTEANVGGANA
ncbi:hypothetical protein EHM69_00940 [candidate division KSB1 bacterium]|nr:MAG: hypothetical protein EHM69_00940 [candidate division KSB1 bacterium]